MNQPAKQPVKQRLPARVALAAAIVAGTLLSAPPAIADAPDATPFVKISIDSVTPAVVTDTSDPEVTVTGRVSNTGDRPVRDVAVRLEQAGAVTESTGLRTPLRGPHDQYRPVGEFAAVVGELQRGQETRFRLSAPLRAESGLHITEPGVYSLLVNVNATPDFGSAARVDDARFLLPVVGLPAGPDGSAPVTVDAADPVQLTMLWPLAARPKLAAGFPGGTTPVRLTDDELAGELAPGGRLDLLISSVDFATSPGADPDRLLERSLCLAVDPDLLITVNAMTGGYLVAPDPAGPGTPGTGQQAAANWLHRLRGLAGRMCVTATPFAQADLSALQQAGEPGLATIATAGAGQVVDQLLGVTSVRGATPLSDAPLAPRTVDLLSAQGDTVAIAAAPAIADGPANADLTPRRLAPRVVLAPFDPAVGAALAAVGTQPSAPTYLDVPANAELKTNLKHDSVAARRQDALGAVLWRALQPAGPAGEENPGDAAPRSEILLPPAVWSPKADDAGALLATLTAALRARLAVPRPLPDLVAGLRGVTAAPEGAPPLAEPDIRARIDGDVIADITGQSNRLWGLTSALTVDQRTGMTGIGYTAPLREDMLRALSQADPPGQRNDLAHRRMAAVGATIDHLIGGVTVVNPGGSYTMATEHSPLPLALRNDLAVPIRVRLHLDTPPGMTVTDPGEIELPPGFLPLRVPIEVRVNQRVAIDAALSTPGGMPLGQSVRLSVHANAYGKVLFAFTLSAAAVLILLAGRRLWHRYRGQPDRADLPEPRGDGRRP